MVKILLFSCLFSEYYNKHYTDLTATTISSTAVPPDLSTSASDDSNEFGTALDVPTLVAVCAIAFLSAVLIVLIAATVKVYRRRRPHRSKSAEDRFLPSTLESSEDDQDKECASSENSDDAKRG